MNIDLAIRLKSAQNDNLRFSQISFVTYPNSWSTIYDFLSSKISESNREQLFNFPRVISTSIIRLFRVSCGSWLWIYRLPVCNQNIFDILSELVDFLLRSSCLAIFSCVLIYRTFCDDDLFLCDFLSYLYHLILSTSWLYLQLETTIETSEEMSSKMSDFFLILLQRFRSDEKWSVYEIWVRKCNFGSSSEMNIVV